MPAGPVAAGDGPASFSSRSFAFGAASMPLTTRRSAFKRPSDPLLIFVFFMAVAMTACFAWNYSGPFRWFAELQLSRTGRFSHQFTLVFTFVALARIIHSRCRLPLCCTAVLVFLSTASVGNELPPFPQGRLALGGVVRQR